MAVSRSSKDCPVEHTKMSVPQAKFTSVAGDVRGKTEVDWIIPDHYHYLYIIV
jgi:hypothetical protein